MVQQQFYECEYSSGAAVQCGQWCGEQCGNEYGKVVQYVENCNVKHSNEYRSVVLQVLIMGIFTRNWRSVIA